MARPIRSLTALVSTAALLAGAQAAAATAGAVLDAFDLQSDHRQPVDDRLERRLGLEMRSQPAERELHRANPPARLD